MNVKTMMEDLHQKFLIEISHVLIFVVSKLSFPEQKLLEHLIEISPEGKKIIVVHNYFNLNNIEDVENAIKNDIMNSQFAIVERQIEKKKKEDLYYKRFFIHEENNNIFHTVIANKFSEAGKFYNESSFNFLRSTIKNLLEIKKINLEEEFIKFLEKYKHNYYYGSEDFFFVRKSYQNNKDKIFIFPEERKMISNVNFSKKFSSIEDNDSIEIESAIMKTQENLNNEEEKSHSFESYANENEDILEVLPFKPDLKKPSINRLGHLGFTQGKQEVLYEISYKKDSKILIKVFIPGLSKENFKNFSYNSDKNDECTTFNFKISWESPLKVYHGCYDKKIEMNCSTLKDNEIDFYLIQLPFDKFVIESEFDCEVDRGVLYLTAELSNFEDGGEIEF